MPVKLWRESTHCGFVLRLGEALPEIQGRRGLHTDRSQGTLRYRPGHLAERKRRYTQEYLLETLRTIYDTHGFFSPALIRSVPNGPSPSVYSRQFRSMAAAFQNLFDQALDAVVKTVRIKLLDATDDIQNYSDFIILNNSFTMLIQPAMPVPYGYQSYWPFFPDQRPVVDLTLAVPLSGEKDCDILGYLALPRLLVQQRSIRLLSPSNSRVELYGHDGLDFVKKLISQEVPS